MAKFKVAGQLVAERLFGGAENPVYIHDATWDHFTNSLVLEISGTDVPEAIAVIAEVQVRQTWAGPKHETLSFRRLA